MVTYGYHLINKQCFIIIYLILKLKHLTSDLQSMKWTQVTIKKYVTKVCQNVFKAFWHKNFEMYHYTFYRLFNSLFTIVHLFFACMLVFGELWKGKVLVRKLISGKLYQIKLWHAFMKLQIQTGRTHTY